MQRQYFAHSPVDHIFAFSRSGFRQNLPLFIHRMPLRTWRLLRNSGWFSSGTGEDPSIHFVTSIKIKFHKLQPQTNQNEIKKPKIMNEMQSLLTGELKKNCNQNHNGPRSGHHFATSRNSCRRCDGRMTFNSHSTFESGVAPVAMCAPFRAEWKTDCLGALAASPIWMSFDVGYLLAQMKVSKLTTP